MSEERGKRQGVVENRSMSSERSIETNVCRIHSKKDQFILETDERGYEKSSEASSVDQTETGSLENRTKSDRRSRRGGWKVSSIERRKM
tara:strand:- start:80 stop:346 length:267 start_codon:yes stop_codon:yes gene_type:complete